MLWNGVTVRHILLTVAALAVFGLGIYLFFEVRETSATAEVPRRTETVARDDQPAPAERTAAPSEVKIPSRAPRPSRIPEPTRAPTPTPTPVADVKPNGTEVQKLDALMAEANKAYDRGDFDEAQTIALRALKLEPTSVRMLRVMVSASCIDGNSVQAQRYYLQLPVPDREQMKTRCDRYGVTFNES